MVKILRGRWSLAVVLSFVLAAPLQAACFADYRAKMDDPLRLHYGVIEISSDTCTINSAGSEISRRLGAAGWELLQVIAVFDEAGLAQRRADAGQYYLRF